jgi:heme/copper-type cytochrome/quinol oxidase subunit 1
MHSLVRRYIKTAIAFLGLGLVLGLVMLVQRETRGQGPTSDLISAHTHVILVGFVMMMILGVALWVFPRPDRGDVHYQPAMASVAYWLVTIGTLTRAAGEVTRAVLANPHLGYPFLMIAILIGGSLQVGGLFLFFYTMWTRIRPAGSREREARGERF